MGFQIQLRVTLLLVLLYVITFSCVTYGAVEVDSSLSRQKQLEVERKLELLNKHAVKSIKSEDGDIIDCIDIYKQPAFDHPALQNHTIQMTPSYDPTMERTIATKKTSIEKKQGDSAVTVTSQLWQRSGSCPEGTIPIRRTRKKDLIKAHSVEDYGRKKPRFSQHLDDTIDSYLQLANHSEAILIAEGFSYSGAKGDIKVWNPSVESDDEYSTSQVSLKNGPYMKYEGIESGWAVNPSVYGDRKTRLFVYWTADSSQRTGCFDLTCPGFVQTNSEIALGAAIYPISVTGGLPYEITLYIFKDPNTSNWWVQYGETINIGYWPPSLFTLLNHHAQTVQWGGEVYSSKLGRTHPHTKTNMGSGHFPDYISGTSGCVKRIRVQQNSLDLMFPPWVETYADEYDCYDVFYLGDYVDDPEFYYGGPGKCYKCP
ncbi:hypothetical protein ACSBR2_040436 [Camellia fascicularis]